MGRKTRVTQTKNTAKDEIEKSLANCVMEADSNRETTYRAGSEAETGSDLEIISKEIRDLKTEIKDAFRAFGETLRNDVRKDPNDFKQDISSS